MKKSMLFFSLAFAIPISLSAQGKSVGINTSKPDPSAILEVSSNERPDNPGTKKKGFLPPRVTLSSSIDVTTIATPAVGLMVYNTKDSGNFPNEVTKDQYYYWDGQKWERLIYQSLVQEAVKPRIFYIESNVGQTFTSAQVNFASGGSADNVVTFESAILNTKNFITFDPATATFKITISGLYEFSSFVNYNPMAATVSGNVNNRAFLNLKIQKSIDNGVSWANTIGSRTAWGEKAASDLKTAILLGTPLQLNTGDMIRVVVANPFNHGANNDHCGAGNCYISNDVANNLPTAKALKIQLLDYNIK
jgi:hypothetical protein